MRSIRKSCQLSLETLGALLSEVRHAATQAGLTEQQMAQVELGTEEALANVWRHGYQEQQGPVEIDYTTDPTHPFIVTIRDYAPPFTWDTLPSTEVKGGSLEERSVGGLGIAMIMRSFDSVSLTQLPDGNVMVLTKEQLSR